jgi:hypothetical protein
VDGSFAGSGSPNAFGISSWERRPKMRIDIQVDTEVILLFLMLLAGM